MKRTCGEGVVLCNIGWCGIIDRDGVERGSVQEAEHSTNNAP